MKLELQIANFYRLSNSTSIANRSNIYIFDITILLYGLFAILGFIFALIILFWIIPSQKGPHIEKRVNGILSHLPLVRIGRFAQLRGQNNNSDPEDEINEIYTEECIEASTEQLISKPKTKKEKTNKTKKKKGEKKGKKNIPVIYLNIRKD